MNEKDVIAAWNSKIPVFYNGISYLVEHVEINQMRPNPVMIQKIILNAENGEGKIEIKDYRFLSLYKEDSYISYGKFKERNSRPTGN